MTGNIWAKGDSNLVAGNIRKGVSIFGVSGSFDFPSGNTFTIFQNGSFTNGTYIDVLRFRERETSTSQQDSFTNSAVNGWVNAQITGSRNGAFHLYGAIQYLSNVTQSVGYFLSLKVPVAAGKSFSIFCDYYAGPTYGSYTGTATCYMGHKPSGQWPSGTWRSPSRNNYPRDPQSANRWETGFGLYTYGRAFSGSATWWCGEVCITKIWADYTQNPDVPFRWDYVS